MPTVEVPGARLSVRRRRKPLRPGRGLHPRRRRDPRHVGSAVPRPRSRPLRGPLRHARVRGVARRGRSVCESRRPHPDSRRRRTRASDPRRLLAGRLVSRSTRPWSIRIAWPGWSRSARCRVGWTTRQSRPRNSSGRSRPRWSGSEQAQDLEALIRIEVQYWDLGPERGVEDVSPEFLERAIELNTGAAHWDFDGEQHALVPPAVDRLGEVAVPTLVVVGDFDVTEAHVGFDLSSRASPAPKACTSRTPLTCRASSIRSCSRGSCASVWGSTASDSLEPCANRAPTQLSRVFHNSFRRPDP